MKKPLLFLFALQLSLISLAQIPKIYWGDDQKGKKATEMNFVTIDPSGIYVQEGGIRVKSYFVVGATYGESVRLRKFNNTYEMEFEYSYTKDLDGKDFNRFFPFNGKLFIFADDYDKKKKEFTTYAAEIDKTNGELKSNWQEVNKVSKQSKADDYEFTVVPANDSASMVLVADISDNEHTSIRVIRLDDRLKQVSSTLLNLSYARNSYFLQEVLFTQDQHIILCGKSFVEEVVSKKKSRWNFKKLEIEKYDLAGKKVLEFPTQTADYRMLSSKLLLTKKNELYVCSFYANDLKSTEINGIMVDKLNPDNGDVYFHKVKDIDPSMVNAKITGDGDDEDGDEDVKQAKADIQKAKKDGNEEEFPSDYVFRRLLIGEDGSALVLAERFTYQSWSSTNTSTLSSGLPRTSTQHHQVYTSGSLMTIKIQPDGNIAWLNVLPKKQVEMITQSGGSTTGYGLSYSSHPIFQLQGMPFYSSFNCIPYRNKLVLIFNDNVKNDHVLSEADKIKAANNMKKSVCYTMSIDLATGKSADRKPLFSNQDEPIAMVRHGMQVGRELYLVGYKLATPLSKPKLKIGKIAVN